MRTIEVKPSQLLLDPNNLRFQDSSDYGFSKESRFGEEGVQRKAYTRIKNDETTRQLKNSIVKNGFLPVERIIVRPYTEEGLYIVVEGNRRIATIKWILEDHESGIDFPDKLIKSLQSFDVLLTEEEGEDKAFRASLMGIRHVSGIKEWGGYQRSKLVSEMRDDLQLDPQETADRLGMSVLEVNRRHRSFRALLQMKDSEEFAQYAKPSLYPIFHEAIANPIIRDDFLKWNNEEFKFENEDKLSAFYSLITPSLDDNGNSHDPKLSTYSEVRALKLILTNEEATESLLDLEKPLNDAIAIASQEELSHNWRKRIRTAIKALGGIPYEELSNMDQEGKDILNELLAKTTDLITGIEKISKD